MTNKESKTSGEILRTLREKEGLTQKELANVVCVDRSTVAKWEGDINNIPLESAQELAQCFQTSVCFLYGNTDWCRSEYIQKLHNLENYMKSLEKLHARYKREFDELLQKVKKENEKF